MAIFGSNPPNVHWSKDYVEHLRTVHFALIVVAITGIIVSRSPDLNILRGEQQQIRTIQNFVKNDLPRLNQSDLTKFPHVKWITFDIGKRKYGAVDPLGSLYYHLTFENCPQDIRQWFDKYGVGMAHESLVSEIDEDKSPSELLYVFMALSCSHGTYYSFHDFGNVLLTNGGQIPFKRMELSGRAFAKSGREEIEMVPGQLKMINGRAWQEFQNLVSRQNVKFSDLKNGAVNSAGELIDVSGITSTPSFVSLPAHLSLEHGKEAPPSLDVLHFPIANCGHLQLACLTEILKLTRTYPDSNWNELGEQVDYELAQAQGKQFELFGIKPPPADESYWFMLAILTVLFYFWLHLRQLSAKVKPSDSGLDVAWPGLYSSVFATAFVWVSVMVIPMAALALLEARSLNYFTGFSFRDRWLISSFGMAAIVTCAILGIQCCLWARRLSALAAIARDQADANPEDQANAGAAKV